MSSSDEADTTLNSKRPAYIPKQYDHVAVYNNYNAWWPYPDGATGPKADEARLNRQQNVCQLVTDYYNLASPAYELGWGEHFHYCPMQPGMNIRESLLAYEVVVGTLTGLKEGMKVLDVGCGIGGPARNIARHFNVKVVGVNISPWHIERGTQLNKQHGLEHMVELVQGDFHNLPFEDNTFDAAFNIQAIGHSSDVAIVYRELHRVLKPGAPFGDVAWAMTDNYDPKIKRHRVLYDQISRGNGLPNLALMRDVRNGLRESGFVTTYEEMLESRSKPGPWYWPLLGMVRYATCKEDFQKALRRETKIVEPLYSLYYWLLVKLDRVPKEYLASYKVMKVCSQSVAVASKIGIFSPMALFVNKNVK